MASAIKDDVRVDPRPYYLKKFMLYKTHSNFYMIGRDKSRNIWRMLKIDRLDPTELNIFEDSTTYSEAECYDLLIRLYTGNKSKSAEGLKLITGCYGIVGFVRFLGPYYMLVITKRRKLGVICGHTVYAIDKCEMIPVPHSSVKPKVAYSQNEKRYKEILCSVDLRKDFFFSYKYNVMHSLQKNFSNIETTHSHYETMFVWNEFLTRGFRSKVKSTIWTVALVYGFFEQIELPIPGRDVKLTLIARRSRHYAGTRYLKRGTNEKGRVANDVETEQIVVENVPEGSPIQMSSVVQNRGSIPLFWSHETSRFNFKPDILLSKKDPEYDATRLHFENLEKRYGKPITILNLIKKREKKPRETILRTEFENAVRYINENLARENHIKFLKCDVHRHSRNKAAVAMERLGRLSTIALNSTGIFYCQVSPHLKAQGSLKGLYFGKSDSNYSFEDLSMKDENFPNSEAAITSDSSSATGNNHIKFPTFQSGVLRTNCIDCLDRTNVAQYAYGLVALKCQLHALGLRDSSEIDLHDPLALILMGIYESMGDKLALQYGGSTAHNKIFSELRGQWKPAVQSQELIRNLQRLYSNAYRDAGKQDAINLFLGHFQPQQGKPSLWELDSDQHYSIGDGAKTVADELRSSIMKSISAESFLCENETNAETPVVGAGQHSAKKEHMIQKSISDPTPVISTCDAETFSSRLPFRDIETKHTFERRNFYHDKYQDQLKSVNFGLDWLSSSDDSCEEDTSDWSETGLSTKNTSECIDITPAILENSPNSSLQEAEFSKDFVRWVNSEDGGMF